jgi:hypothetical protein
MNKLIQELLQQSTDNVLGVPVVNQKKFAELIVAECAAIADTERPNSVGCGYITKTNGMLIKEHFGVEE